MACALNDAAATTQAFLFFYERFVTLSAVSPTVCQRLSIRTCSFNEALVVYIQFARRCVSLLL